MQFNLEGSFRVRELVVKFKSGAGKCQSLSDPASVDKLLRPMLIEEPREKFVGLYLDTQNHLAALEVISQGTSNCSLVSPRESFKTAFLVNASSVIFVHNHPSGNPTPSKEDIEIAIRLKEAARILDFEMLDFVIIAREGYYSFAASQPKFNPDLISDRR